MVIQVTEEVTFENEKVRTCCEACLVLKCTEYHHDPPSCVFRSGKGTTIQEQPFACSTCFDCFGFECYNLQRTLRQQWEHNNPGWQKMKNKKPPRITCSNKVVSQWCKICHSGDLAGAQRLKRHANGCFGPKKRASSSLEGSGSTAKDMKHCPFVGSNLFQRVPFILYRTSPDLLRDLFGHRGDFQEAVKRSTKAGEWSPYGIPDPEFFSKWLRCPWSKGMKLATSNVVTAIVLKWLHSEDSSLNPKKPTLKLRSLRRETDVSMLLKLLLVE